MAEKLDYAECISQIPTSYATVSIGTPTTPLPEKLRAIASAGFAGIELGFPDLVSYASQVHGREIKATEYPQLCQAGEEVKKICQELGLRIMMLQPFSNFEGWKHGSPEREDAVKRAAGWIEVMRAVNTDMLQVWSSVDRWWSLMRKLTLPRSAHRTRKASCLIPTNWPATLRNWQIC